MVWSMLHGKVILRVIKWPSCLGTSFGAACCVVQSCLSSMQDIASRAPSGLEASAWCLGLEVSGGSPRRSYGLELRPGGCAMHVGLLKALENGCCSCWTTVAWFWVLRRVVVKHAKPQTTLVAKFVSSLSPRSSSPSADGLRQKIIRPMSHLAPSVTARACTPMLTNVGRLQRGQPLTRGCLPSSQPKPVKKRKLESNRQVAPALVSPTRIEEGWKQVRRRREERGRARARAHTFSGESVLSASPLRRVVLPRAEPSHRSHVQPRSTSSWPLQKCRWTS